MSQPAPTAVHRIEVSPSLGAGDPLGESVRRASRSLGVEVARVTSRRVYLVEAALTAAQVQALRGRLLTDPILETSVVGHVPAQAGDRVIEVHPLPGVMDPGAQTVRDMVRELAGTPNVRVVTGTRYDLAGVDAPAAERLARRLLANPVIESVHFEPWLPVHFPEAKAADQTPRRVPMRELDDEALVRLSRDGHLFLSLDEMRAIRDHYRAQHREPTDIELETLAQTWSEHCVHKTLKSSVTYRVAPGTHESIEWSGRPGVRVNADGSVTISNLLKSTVAAATHELIRDGLDWTLSVFVDNAGVIAFDDTHAINVKVETHNRPSAIEPYGGAATGIGGCIRDVIGTGLGARPIASTDIFCVAYPDHWTESAAAPAGAPAARPLPPGVLHPRRVLTRVIDGVRDYGNRMGIPTVSGAVAFDDRYVGNPLVFCGCVGLMPRDKIKGAARAGDRIIALGGRTGRDGIHGATFSSAELTHTHADEFAHAVQIGNAIEEKRVLDAILRARDHSDGCLFSGLTDCGAGGFSSAVGEMAKDLGAQVHLERAPLKYEGLRYDEIWISESQERMVLAVPERHVAALRAICEEEGTELADLGHFGTPDRDIVLLFQGNEVGRLSCDFLHDGIPMPVREAQWERVTSRAAARGPGTPDPRGIKRSLLELLAEPNIASKKWIVRQYDHEVQGNTVIKPLVGPGGIGPGDASVIQPVAGSQRGLAIACGLATSVGDPALGGDPYDMALAAIDECVRNLVCVGADPARIAILDNFCWPSCAKPANMASLVRACMGCYDAAKAYRTPFVSGKDSLNNQFRYTDPATGREVTIEIPPTLLISGIAIVPDVGRCVTMDLKPVDGSLVIALSGVPEAGGAAARESVLVPRVRAAKAVASLILDGAVLAAHDSSEGGPLVALAEMCLASGVGARCTPEALAEPFHESPGVYLLQVRGEWFNGAGPARLAALGVRATAMASVDQRLEALGLDAQTTVGMDELSRAFLGTLDW